MKSADLYPPATDGAADSVSAAYDLGDLQTYSIDINFSGSDLIGTLTLQARNSDTSDYVTVTNSSQAVTAGASHVWNVAGAAYRYVRVNWVWTSGSGTISAKFIAKVMQTIGGS